jgi:hypothetical protein
MSDIKDLAAAIDALRAETAELKAQLAKLGDAAKPPERVKSEPHAPIDYTRGASMPPSALRDLAAAIPDSLARDLRGDAMRGNPATQSRTMLTPDRGGEVQRGSGWRAPNPISPPPGIDHCDRMVDQQDRVDRADLERRLARSVKRE